MEVLKAINILRVRTRQVRDNDFFSDRMSHRHTNMLIGVFFGLATFKRFLSAPINCWVPAELRRYEKFINKYCWLRGTFYVKEMWTLRDLDLTERNEAVLFYYQWVPLFLLFQAFLFYLPRLFWSFISDRILNYSLFDMVDAAIKSSSYGQDRNKGFQYLLSNLKIHFENNYPKAGGLFMPFRTFNRLVYSRLLMLTYFFTKIFYLVIAILQLYGMNVLLSSNQHSFYGHQVLRNIMTGEADIIGEYDSRIFPRVTVCDIKTRELGTDHHHTVQCILTLNMFNERIYVFLWFWVFFVLLPFIVVDLLRWTIIIFFLRGHYQYRFIRDRLSIFGSIPRHDKKKLRVFAQDYIGADGVFVLRLLERNSNAIIVSELILELWNNFNKYNKH